jgi:osmotically-inducible protein OsmY
MRKGEAKMRQTLVITFLVVSLARPLMLSGRTRREVPARAVERIQRQVRHEILMLPYYGVFDNITYKVEGYKVTLMGQVTWPTLRSEAENVVKRIEGVEKITNRIEVLPTSILDDQLRVRIYRAIYGYPALERYAMPVVKPIRIIVKNGNLTLEGVVDREADKNMVYLRANGVPDVFSVTNHLRVVKP